MSLQSTFQLRATQLYHPQKEISKLKPVRVPDSCIKGTYEKCHFDRRPVDLLR